MKRVEEEARRRGGSPSGVLAEIVEHWARELTDETEAPEGHAGEEHSSDAGRSAPVAARRASK
ncbi:MAG TPA: hypothetical protein VGG91_10060 [Myxococcaceae bacterium]